MSKIAHDKTRAYAAAQWASGISQRIIAKEFGIATGSVCNAIGEFITKWSGAPTNTGPYAPGMVTAQGEERRALVKQALERWRNHSAPS